jgi:hypothetical protein
MARIPSGMASETGGKNNSLDKKMHNFRTKV